METGQKLVISEAALEACNLDPQVVAVDRPAIPEGHALVVVHAAAVNPSDVKAAMGLMPHAIWPRIPGRDYAGTVLAGPDDWIGADVWGTGGDLGVARDGTHASYLVLPLGALCRKPEVVPVRAAATVGVPFVTAHEGLTRAGLAPGQTVVVFGANGKVGQAAIQLASAVGARVIGVERGNGGYVGHASGTVTVVDGESAGARQAILDLTEGRGADIAYNTVGSPYFQVALDTLAIGGTQVLISTIEKVVPFDVLSFYRRNLRMIGVDSLKLSATRCAGMLNELLPAFESGRLKAFSVHDDDVYPLQDAAKAYRRVLAGSIERVVLVP